VRGRGGPRAWGFLADERVWWPRPRAARAVDQAAHTRSPATMANRILGDDGDQGADLRRAGPGGITSAWRPASREALDAHRSRSFHVTRGAAARPSARGFALPRPRRSFEAVTATRTPQQGDAWRGVLRHGCRNHAPGPRLVGALDLTLPSVSTRRAARHAETRGEIEMSGDGPVEGLRHQCAPISLGMFASRSPPRDELSGRCCSRIRGS